MMYPILVLAIIVSSCAVAEFSSEIVVASGENVASSAENRSGELSTKKQESLELLETSHPSIQPMISYNTPEVVQFPRFDTNTKNGDPVLKYYKRFILTPQIMNSYPIASGLRPRPFFRYSSPNGRPIKRTFMANKPLFMPKFMYSERPEYIFSKPAPFFRPFRSLPPITATKPSDAIFSSPIRTSSEYAQMRPAKPRIPDYIYQQPAVSSSVRIPTFVRPPGSFLLSHGHQQSVPVPQQFSPVKFAQQQPKQYQPSVVSGRVPGAVSLQVHSPNYALPPQALAQQKEQEYVSVSQTVSQPMVATSYQPVQYQVRDSVREGTQEVSVVDQNSSQKSGYMKVLVPTVEQFVAVPEPTHKYILTGQRLIYKSPQPQTIYVTHQPQYSTLIAQPPIDSTPQYVTNNQDATHYATITQPALQELQVPLSSPYSQSSYSPGTADYRLTDSPHNYRTAEADQLLTALRAHKVMAQYTVADDQDIIVGTMKKEESSEQDGDVKSTGLWSTLTGAVNVSNDYDATSAKDNSFNAIVEVPAPKLTPSGT